MRKSRGFTTFMSTERGFTLVELLVVITIIAVLSAIAIVSYSNVLKTSRDSKRMSDLKIIQSALEEYHADQIYYPMIAVSCTDGFFTVNCPLKNPGGTRTYLNNVPTDPLTSNDQYNYQQKPTGCDNSTATKCTGYCIFANLEGPAKTSDSGCTPAVPYDYGVAKP